MAQLIQIGNSQGVRIPKALIEQAQLAGKELSMELVKEGILIKPLTKARTGWAEKINNSLQGASQENLDQEWLDAELTDNQWEW